MEKKAFKANPVLSGNLRAFTFDFRGANPELIDEQLCIEVPTVNIGVHTLNDVEKELTEAGLSNREAGDLIEEFLANVQKRLIANFVASKIMD